ncbi:hypothetical protein E306M_11140 [Moorella sp. E306M]|nr:hypothetical protein E306M_11140 [Moorella sp. E306M]
MITISQNSREMAHTFARISGGAVDLGLASVVNDQQLVTTICDLMSNRKRREEMRANLLRFNLKNGIDNVIHEILSIYDKWRINKRQEKEIE